MGKRAWVYEDKQAKHERLSRQMREIWSRPGFKENHPWIRHLYSDENKAFLRKARMKQRKLTDRQVRQIRKRRAKGETQMSLAAEFGVSQTVISFLLNGKTYGWVK